MNREPLFSCQFFYKTVFHSCRRGAESLTSIPKICHLLTDSFQVNIGAAFDDQFIMDVPDDETVPKSFHGITEDISADGLHDILHEPRSVRFDAFPFLRMHPKSDGAAGKCI